MADDLRPSSDYRWAREVAALVLIGVIVLIVALDAITDDYEVRTPGLVPLLLTVAGLLSVDGGRALRDLRSRARMASGRPVAASRHVAGGVLGDRPRVAGWPGRDG